MVINRGNTFFIKHEYKNTKEDGAMQHIRVVVLLFLLLIPLSACSKSPETARKELGQMNIDYTDDSFFNYVERGDKVVVELFLTAGKSSNLREKTFERSILSIAAFGGHDEIVKLLIAKGADVNGKSKNGWTPLVSAGAKENNLETVKILLNKGADVNAEITDGPFRGETPLTLAVGKKEKYRNIVLVKAMLNKGGVNDKNLREALLLAKEVGYTEAVDILKKAGAKE